ncbi:MAG TPA: aldehyde dehydrogenase, partial [Flavobacterium sp.]|nr:aldehyde dehydrogenase [Flavobacterium sp.]
MSSISTVAKRKSLLKKLLIAIKKHESEVIEALHNDFKKPEFESYLT